MRRAFILTDRNCLPIGRRVAITMQQTGIQVGGCAIVPVPQHRGVTVVPRIHARMEKFGMDFRTVFIGVGGNLVLDLAGAIASSEEMGLTLYQVPTTLSALLDGSVGGRTLTYDREGKRKERKWCVPKATFADPTVLDHLGDLYHRLGRYQLALTMWRRALESEPLDPDVIQNKIDAGALRHAAPRTELRSTDDPEPR